MTTGDACPESIEDGAALAAALKERVWRLVCLANAVGMVIILITATFAGPVFPTSEAHDRVVALVYGIGLPHFAVAALMGRRHVATSLGPVTRWLSEERTPTVLEQRSLLAQPWRHIRWASPYWAVVVILAAPVAAVGDLSLPFVLRMASVVISAYVIAMMLTMLLVERALRPAFARSLAGEAAAGRRGMGVRARLVAAWVATSAVPFTAIAYMPLGLDAERRLAMWSVALTTALVAVVAGVGVTLLVARSIDDPLRRVRTALRRVEAGDLTAMVDVDDATEVGFVQAGFNRMVQALHERQQLHELFGRHVGSEVAARALESGGILGGEQRTVSVLFVDVLGSTGLAQRHAPADVVARLNAFFAVVVRTVASEGGWVNKFEGDAALCVFGAPEDAADHAVQALRAARRLRGEIAALATRFPDLDAAIGVSTGEAVAGNIGAEQRYEYTVIGDPVNEAARLTERAKRAEARVFASATTVQAAGDEESAHWTHAGTVQLRGRQGRTSLYLPVDAYVRSPA